MVGLKINAVYEKLKSHQIHHQNITVYYIKNQLEIFRLRIKNIVMPRVGF
jgi:hypothetical protein